MDRNKIIAVVGPTASGKSDLAIQLCKRFDGEVISFDSMQIYKGMDIATAKPSKAQLEEVPHHLISFIDPSERYSVAQFVEDAGQICRETMSKNKLPVFCGGTGLYIDSFVNNISFTSDGFSSEVRDRLLQRLSAEGIESLYDELKLIDGDYAEKLKINDEKRIVRALELYLNTGVKMSEQIKNSKSVQSEFETLYIGLAFEDRAVLYDRINKRVDLMINNGLIDEAKYFFELNKAQTAKQAIGIKELAPYFDGLITLEEAVEKIKRETRRYAKRQITWFKRNESINWIYVDKSENILDEAICLTEKFLKGDE